MPTTQDTDNPETPKSGTPGTANLPIGIHPRKPKTANRKIRRHTANPSESVPAKDVGESFRGKLRPVEPVAERDFRGKDLGLNALHR